MNTPATSDKPPAPPASADLQTLLDHDRPRRWWQRPLPWIAAATLVLLAGGLYYWQMQKQASAAPAYVTETVRRGNLTLSVTANGTLQPTLAVNIGSELSGTVKRVLVDVNDLVKKGQVLVELDTAKLSDQVLRSRAALAAAQAQLAQSTATVTESRATLARFEDVARLSGGKVPSATELDTARANVDRALANEASARANVADARAAASTDETNLAKASIRSPLNGVVLTRTVDPGNAVAASLQAVTLFTVAEDLTKLRLEVSVDEADVGAVKVGQKASFTVSAYPSRRYPATITRVAFGSTKTDNVVTYTSYLDVDNTDLSLRPGMTATATIVATERTNVLLVPNTALRFSPSPPGGNTTAAASSGSLVSRLMPRMPRTATRKATDTEGAAAGARQVWILKDGQAVATAVRTGISDGRMTEVSGSGLQEGMAVITDQRAPGAAP
ncbi:efflux RND transporter periplasmic adaptor subunit [Rhodoferax sediminis]|uniref:Efflux RND transporter periplasmic adaptor subunit n=1 Tax=Rhodoferax sediminis TaxID=2509614 RepID=A0A515DA94_9BURK|nr:efflux RND transporter periplasmic adaptor subunit [Rhodoferax sediminis]QDL37333.1 efflux RND transporter periplasmic adaptor subunit [Rhodoferax sediminis]